MPDTNETPKNKLYSLPFLLDRYSVMSKDGKKPLSYRTLFKWRERKGFPEPVIRRPGLMWLRKEVHEWEVAQGYDFLSE